MKCNYPMHGLPLCNNEAHKRVTVPGICENTPICRRCMMYVNKAGFEGVEESPLTPPEPKVLREYKAALYHNGNLVLTPARPHEYNMYIAAMRLNVEEDSGPVLATLSDDLSTLTFKAV